MESLGLVLNAGVILVGVVATVLLWRLLEATRSAQRADASAANLGEVGDRVDALGEHLARISQQLRELGDRYDASSESLRGALEQPRPEVNALISRLEGFESALQSVTEQMASSTSALSEVRDGFDRQAERAAELVAQAGERVNELDVSSQRHGEALRAAAMASLEELVRSGDEIADALREIRDRQAATLERQEAVGQILDRLAVSLDGYVEVLRQAA